MRVALLTIGNELLLGRTIDSNGHYLATELNALGAQVVEKRSVVDDPKAIQRALGALHEVAPLIITTGGLGPTRDDLTRQVVADYANLPLEIDSAAATRLKEFHQNRPVTWNPTMQAQASKPQGAIALNNPTGAACGFWLDRAGQQIISLPGVPSEMQSMWQQHVQPKLQASLPKTKRRHVFTCRTLGLTESAVDQLATTWFAGLPSKDRATLAIGLQIRFPEVHLIFYIENAAYEPLHHRLETELPALLGENFVDFSHQPLEALVHEQLVNKGLTLAVAESCTGGYIQSLFTSLPGASAYFLGGVVSYDNAAKERLLGVQANTLSSKGAVSSECALEMAVGVKQSLNADIGLSTTGILGPTGGSCDKPVGLVFGAIVTPSTEQVSCFQLKRDRLLNRRELTTRMLLLLLQQTKNM